MSKLLPVETTDPKYNVLTHVPTGATFDGDGKSMFPLDQFTSRLIADGSVRLVEAGKDEPRNDEEAPVIPATKE